MTHYNAFLKHERRAFPKLCRAWYYLRSHTCPYLVGDDATVLTVLRQEQGSLDGRGLFSVGLVDAFERERILVLSVPSGSRTLREIGESMHERRRTTDGTGGHLSESAFHDQVPSSPTSSRSFEVYSAKYPVGNSDNANWLRATACPDDFSQSLATLERIHKN